MTNLPEENTLGAIIGAPWRRRESDATRRVISAATPQRSSLGTGFIGIGAAVVVALRSIYGIVWFVSLWPTYPDPVPALLAWVILLVTVTATFIAARVIADQFGGVDFALDVALARRHDGAVFRPHAKNRLVELALDCNIDLGATDLEAGT